MTNLEHKKGGKACALYQPLGRLWQEDEEGADEQVVGGKGNGEELGGRRESIISIKFIKSIMSFILNKINKSNIITLAGRKVERTE